MIGSYIRQLREDQGYLLRQLAAMIDIDATILSKMEREERVFKREHIIALSKVFKLEEEKLLTIWLADRIEGVLKNEKCAIKALELIKEKKNNEA